MNALDFLLKKPKALKLGLIASLAIFGSGITLGANAGLFGGAPPEQNPPAADSPESEAASQRVETAKVKLDQAHKQLDAAKARVKAADAEFKAARADKEALALKTQAQKLADDSGLPNAAGSLDSSLISPMNKAIDAQESAASPASTSPTIALPGAQPNNDSPIRANDPSPAVQ